MPYRKDFSITISRSARRRRTVALLVQPEGDVRVMAPVRMSLRAIERLVRQKAGWIRKRLESLRLNPPRRSVQTFADGAEAPYLGKTYKVRLTQKEAAQTVCIAAEGEMAINVPDAGPEGAALREEARLELKLWYKKQARREFRERLAVWSARLGVKPGRLIVTSPLRRWGSCNSKNEIRVNYRLIMASPDVIDYVLAHELAHIRHKNHGRAFWRCLEKVMPDHKERRRQLRAWEKAES